MGRESPEVPVAPGVDDCRARPGRDCQNGQDHDLEPRALPVFGRSFWVAGIRPRSGHSAAATWFGPTCRALAAEDFDLVNRHDESRGAGRAQDGPPLLAAVTRVEQLVRLRRPHNDDPWTVAGYPWREDEGGHPRRRPRECHPRH